MPFVFINAINENLTYKYNSKGNIIEVQENGKFINRYQYDGLSRLIREDNKALQKTVTYSYDAGGNILMRTEYAFTLKQTSELDNGISYSYNYPVSGWRDQLISYNGESFVYDALGNPTTYRNKTLQWSHGRQLDSFGDIATYTYNANGTRISKNVNGITTKFYLNGNQIICQDNGNKLLFHYGMDGITGFTLQLSETISRDFTYKKNLQGDIIGIYDQNNTLFCKYVYDAWGNHKTFVLVGNDYVELNDEIESTYASIAQLNPFRYRGYYFDIETGLYYLNSRYYDPKLGRFINADSIENLDTDNLNGLNLYMYCANNPIMNIDVNGKFFISFFIGLAVAAITVAIVNTGVQLVEDVIDYAITGEWDSSWEDYAGAFIGGLAGGATFFLTGGNLVATFGIMNGVETFSTNLLTNITGKTNYTFGDILSSTIISSGIGMLTGWLFGGTKIRGATIGRNNFLSLWKAGLTKLRNGTNSKMSIAVMLKGFTGFATLKSGGTVINGVLSGIYDWVRELFLKGKGGINYV